MSCVRAGCRSVRVGRAALLALLPLWWFSPLLAAGQGVVPAAPPSAAVPLPAWVASAEVIDDGSVVYVAPDERAARRGTLVIGTRLPVTARVHGSGCGDFRFVQVGEEAFVCERALVWSRQPPLGVAQPPVPVGSLLPHEYAFVVSDGTPGYARPSDYETDDYAVVLAQDFGLMVSERVRYAGVSFVRSRHGYYVLDESLVGRPISTFGGMKLDGSLAEAIWPARKPAPRGKLGKPHVPPLVAPPSGVGVQERWVVVDTQSQTLVVYEGARPIFATLVSTGLANASTETPTGEFRVWAKLATSDMNDTEREDVEHNYSIESVPWVVFFHESIALHAAFWHDRFGDKRSHGCVNLSPRDARTVFDLLAPALPDGWYAIVSTGKQPGSRVIVR
jgi:L,D-transpeptidase catalytic domain